MRVKKSKQRAEEYNPYAYNVLQNLRDAGCTDELVEEFMALESRHEQEQQIRLLTLHRKTLLQKLHREEKRIDCLDYLLYRIQNKN